MPQPSAPHVRPLWQRPFIASRVLLICQLFFIALTMFLCTIPVLNEISHRLLYSGLFLIFAGPLIAALSFLAGLYRLPRREDPGPSLRVLRFFVHVYFAMHVTGLIAAQGFAAVTAVDVRTTATDRAFWMGLDAFTWLALTYELGRFLILHPVVEPANTRADFAADETDLPGVNHTRADWDEAKPPK